MNTKKNTHRHTHSPAEVKHILSEKQQEIGDEGSCLSTLQQSTLSVALAKGQEEETWTEDTLQPERMGAATLFPECVPAWLPHICSGRHCCAAPYQPRADPGCVGWYVTVSREVTVLSDA